MEDTTEPLRTTDEDVLTALADDERRRVLACVRGHDEPVSAATLAAAVTAQDDGLATDGGEDQPPEAGAASDLRVALHHVHLPALDDAGLVHWNRAAGRVRPASDPPVDEWALRRVLASDEDCWTALFQALEDPRRRTALAVLARTDGPMARRDLATAVAAHEGDGVPVAEDVQTVEVSLRHRHLPVLEDAGLVRWNPDAGRVGHRGHPNLDLEWGAAGAEGRGPSAASVAGN